MPPDSNSVGNFIFLRNIPLLSVFFLFVTAPFASAGPALSLQELIEQTPAGTEVPLQPGKYFGPVIITKPLILDGHGQVTIDGQGKDSVLTIKADNVVVKNITFTGSGDSHDRLDSGILIRSASNVKILNNTIDNCLFGIDLQETHDSVISGNDISSQDAPLGLRGDGIRGWASHRNIYSKNRIHDSRDMVIWYSNDNIIEENEGWNNRYSLHFMYSGGNTVRNNKYHHNTVGIFLMYSRDVLVEHNEVRYSLGGTGVGIGLKEVDNLTIQHNKVIYCTSGFYFDLSPFQPEKYNFIKANTIAYCVVGFDFNSVLERNIIKGNRFIDNLEVVRVKGNGVATGNVWEGNYYSDYEGFDRDQDGYGDFIHKHDVYLDTLWMNNDWMLMFSGSPVISVINLLARLAPISEPRRLFSDEKPVFSSGSALLASVENLAYDPPMIDIEKEDDDEFGVPARFAEYDDEEDVEEEIPEDSAQKDNFNRYFLRQ
ncbi:MAG: nitrous oxide reductase family maturation protein NosD [Desulfobulbaceae bacterium]|nr:nitrous oxide reductase family maturation protein NosD [Desulfobulbaceae bacterium]